MLGAIRSLAGSSLYFSPLARVNPFHLVRRCNCGDFQSDRTREYEVLLAACFPHHRHSPVVEIRQSSQSSLCNMVDEAGISWEVHAFTRIATEGVLKQHVILVVA
jgi:hypothetical protein